MNPTGAQLRVLQEGAMRTRLDSRPRKTRPEKRQCATLDCSTLLSSYNEGDHCSLCGGWPSSPVSSYEHRGELADALEDEAA